MFLGLALSNCRVMLAQAITVLSESVVSDAMRDSHEWYNIAADPEDANYLIACGMKWDSRDNAQYGFIYSSEDGGKIWHVAFEDKHSKWVSEESCAFGAHGVAYFVADASKIDAVGRPHHDQGTTRIYVSQDAGNSWSLGAETGWTDFSASVVDRNPGPDQNRFYIVFNNLWNYYSSIHDQGKLASLPKPTDKVSEFDTAGNSIGLISYRDGDKRISGPILDPEMYKLRLHGSYPGQNLMLKDGSLLTLFWSKRRVFDRNGKRNGREFLFAAQHTDPQRKSLSEPVIIQHWLEAPDQPEMKCDSYLAAPAAYDPASNTVYAAYLDGSGGKCSLMLARSNDDGQTWTSSLWKEKLMPGGENAIPPEHDYNGLALARRNDGTLSLLWNDSDKPGVWLFAISTDDGKTYDPPQQISITPAGDGRFHLSSGSLDFYVNQAREDIQTDDASMRILNHNGGVGTVHTNGIAVTSDGVFHPIWTVNGQLYTAAIAVTKPRDSSKPEPPRTVGWQYETNRVKFTYGGNQSYDKQNQTLSESLVIRNSGTDVLKGPLRLEITPSSRVGVIYPLGVVTEGAGDNIGQYLDVSQYIPGDGLAPGASSSPIPLRFRFAPYADAKQSGSVANISLRLLTKGAK
jgi:hypothetical protein